MGSRACLITALEVLDRRGGATRLGGRAREPDGVLEIWRVALGAGWFPLQLHIFSFFFINHARLFQICFLDALENRRINRGHFFIFLHSIPRPNMNNKNCTNKNDQD